MTYVLILLLHATPWSFTTKRHGPLEAGASEPSLCARLCSSHIGATHCLRPSCELAPSTLAVRTR